MDDYILTGLSSKEVQEQMDQNNNNDFEDTHTKSITDILKDNLFNLFNFIVLVITLALFFVGAYANMLFLFIIIINILVGVIQEIIAKKLVEKLTLLNATKCFVIRDSKQVAIDVKDLVIGDLMVLESSQLINCDSVVVDGSAEVNEALLTGESKLITKTKDAHLLSGSYVVSGKCFAKIVNVGINNYATKIAIDAKKHKKSYSKLMHAMNQAIKLSTLIIIPAGIALFTKGFFLENSSLHDTVVTTSAAVIGMLPIGVILLITTSLAIGVIKLSKMRILVQELYAVESLSRVDMLCLDKTGTLTQGEMSVFETHILNDDYSTDDIYHLMSKIICASQENNATFKALEAAFDATEPFEIFAQSHFNSQRKWSSVSLTANSTYYLGAPEIILKNNVSEHIKNYIAEGQRIILLAISNQINDSGIILDDIIPIAAIALTDPLRKNASETISYFKKQGVQIRLISGDNPVTVCQIAKQVDIDNYDKFIDLTNVDDDKLDKIALDYTIFGRATPSQKKHLIQIFKKQGHTVAMTGDGVNDVLALKEADCSIAMAQGSDAAKQVSQLVLLDSDFASLPNIINEGRRVVNNMIKVASVYFIKTFYSALLTILAFLTATTFPFIPIQVTLINAVIVGIPTFLITFEKNDQNISQDFLKVTLKRSIPSAFIIFFMAIMIKMFGTMLKLDHSIQITLMYYVVAFVTYVAVIKACQPLTLVKRLLLLISATTFIAVLSFYKPLLQLSTFNSSTVFVLIFILLICFILIKLSYKFDVTKSLKKGA